MTDFEKAYSVDSLNGFPLENYESKSFLISEINKVNDVIDLSREGHEYHQNKYPKFFKNFNIEIARNDIEKILLENKGVSFVAKVKDENIAYILCKIKYIEENDYRYGYSVLYIDQIVVKQEYRKNGIAQILIDRSVQKAKELKLDKVELTCWYGNKEALGLYKKNDFKETRVAFEREI